MWSGTTSFISGNEYWHLCVGSSLSQSDYPDLYANITNGGLQFPFGPNPSGTTFLLPNLEDRFVVGGGNLYGRGGTGGSKDSVVISHGHVGNASNQPNHVHNVVAASNHAHEIPNQATHGHNTQNAGNHSHGGNTAGAGSHSRCGNWQCWQPWTW